MVASIEGDLALEQLEALGWFYPREDSTDLLRELLEVAVGEGGLCPTEDAGDVGLGLLVAPGVLLGLLLIPVAWVRHGSIHLRVGLGWALLLL